MKYKRYLTGIFLIAGIVCCGVLFAAAQTKPKHVAALKAQPAGTVTAAGIIDNFFKKYKDEGSGEAIDYLFSTNKFFSNPAGINRLKAKLDSLNRSLGVYLGKELITQKSATPSLILYSYLVKHEIQPVRFTFIFYKPHNDWVFYRFLFDDQMDVEMEDAAKIGSTRHP